MIDRDRLAALMARFEAGADTFPGNPFDMEAALSDPEYITMVYAFARTGAEDTPSEDRAALVQAGLLQGLCLGYSYATEDTDEEGAPRC